MAAETRFTIPDAKNASPAERHRTDMRYSWSGGKSACSETALGITGMHHLRRSQRKAPGVLTIPYTARRTKNGYK